MHAALIVPAPFDTVSGGYEYDRRIVAGLREAGHSVRVVELAGAHPIADAVASEAARAAWDTVAAASWPIIDGLALPAFAELEDGLVARRTAALVHHPTSLETGFSESERAALQAIERRLLPKLARICVTSEATSQYLSAEFGVSGDRIRIVVPGTDDASRSTGSGGPTCRILAVGTLVPRKGHDLLLRALARLFDLDWHLTIVGSPERDPLYARALTVLAEELGTAKRVNFAGVLSREALELLWRETDLFALATQWEGYGMAIAEALRRGVPVVVTNGGAAGLLVTPEAGVVCPAGDQTNLSKALRRMIFGKDLRHGMAEAAWQVGRALPDWPTQVRRFAEALAD